MYRFVRSGNGVGSALVLAVILAFSLTTARAGSEIALAGEAGVVAVLTDGPQDPPVDHTWTRTSYEYDETNLLPRIVDVVASDGAARRTVTVFAHEVFDGSGGTVNLGASGTHQLTEVAGMEILGGWLAGESPVWNPAPLACSFVAFRQHGTAAAADHRTAGCGAERDTTFRFEEYDPYGRPLVIAQSTGLRGIIEYDGLKITSITRQFRRYYGSEYDDVALKQTFEYDGAGRLVTATDENGIELRYAYDGLGRLIQVERYTPPSPPLLARTETLAEHEYYLSALAAGGYNDLLPNYVRTRVIAGLSVDDDVTTAYFDGLGREMQSQQRMPDGAVAVSMPDYDELGRPVRQWRPVELQPSEAPNPEHGFIPLPLVRVAALDHYANVAGNLPEAPNDEDGRPFSSVRYEDSPLSRVEEERAPGTSTLGPYSGSGTALTYTYGVGRARASAPLMNYTETIDGDGRWTRTYVDGLGRERFVVRGMNAETEAVLALVYDAADRLVQVRPPNYFAQIDRGDADPLESNPSHPSFELAPELDWITAYTYDSRGLLLRKRTPDTRNAAESGAGTHRYRHDRHGRLRYSQDPEQRARGVVGFIAYDRMGRPLQSGVGRPEPCDPANGDPEDCWGLLDPDAPLDYPANVGNRIVDAYDQSCEIVVGEVSTPCHWEWIGHNRRAQYHYDDPGHLGASGNPVVQSWPFSGVPGHEQRHTRGRLVAVAYRTEGLWQTGPAARWQSTFFSYDGQGNVVDRLVRTSTPGQPLWDRFTYEYDRQGKLLVDSVRVGDHRLAHFYSYDRRGLLTEVHVSTSGTKPGSPDVELSYLVDGAVEQRRLGNGAANLSYTYDVAGRIVEIGNVGGDQQPFAARYLYSPGGLIEEMQTHSEPAAQACLAAGIWHHACTERWRYRFAYDALGRLTDGSFAGYHPGSGWENVPPFNLQGMTYDPQGNILGLTRWAPTENSAEVIDQLVYQYQSGTNRLIQVTDAMETDLHWDAKPTVFTYDRAGNVIEMVETLAGGETRRTTVLRVDERNLPERLRISLGYHQLGVDYAYDAEGQRVAKRTYTAGVTEPGSPDPHYSYERYVRDGMRLVGVFDGEGNLKWWNLGGAAGTAGRLDPVLNYELSIAQAISTATEGLEENTEDLVIAALVGLGVDIRDAEFIAQESLSEVLDVALGGVEAAAQAAGDPQSGADEASGTHYKHTVGATETALHDAMMAYWGDPELADRFAPEAAPLAASSMAEIVGNAVAASFVATPAGTFARRYYISDHLGSIRTVVTASGNVIESRDYYPYGLMMPGRTSTTGTPAREGYTGHELDAETGMYYAGARYYMPALGRWTAVDPLAAMYVSWSPYNYALQSPTNNRDPDGRFVIAANLSLDGMLGIVLGGLSFSVAVDHRLRFVQVSTRRVGGGVGLGGSGGLSVTAYPFMASVRDLEGWGAQGGIFVGGGIGVHGEMNISMRFDDPWEPLPLVQSIRQALQSDVGGTGSVLTRGVVGGGVYAAVSRSSIEPITKAEVVSRVQNMAQSGISHLKRLEDALRHLPFNDPVRRRLRRLINQAEMVLPEALRRTDSILDEMGHAARTLHEWLNKEDEEDEEDE